MQQASATGGPTPAAAKPVQSPPDSGESVEAPPKQVALAMDRLSRAGRVIADIRLGADRLLEALFVASRQPQQSPKPLQSILKEEASMRNYLQELRTIGRQLEDSGVLNESLRSRSNSWGLHMPLVCPDGAVVAYAWKRQLAGQAGASAVDRTRLALKAFTDQKRRFFPHLDDGAGGESVSKRHSGFQLSTDSHEEELNDDRTLSDILLNLEREVQNVKVFTYERLDWLKRASSLPSSSNECTVESSKEHNFDSSNNLRRGTRSVISADKVAVIELLFPSVFRAVVSLHPAGSIDPDAVAFFSPDEEHAGLALQYFLGRRTETSLHSLLHWICSYQNLFSKVCSKCGRLLSMDTQAALLLPPVQRPYRNFTGSKPSSTQQSISSKDQSVDDNQAYHVDCFPEET